MSSVNAAVAMLLFQAIAVVPAAPETRPLVIRVRDSSKVPVRGARVVVEPAVLAEMALAELLAKRAGVSKEDGLLDLGLVPATQPITLRIGAPGFRPGTLKLSANFEPGRRDVFLVPNQDVEVRVAGIAQRRGEARAEVTLARCRMQQPGTCMPQEPLRRPLDGEGRARFKAIEGGRYQVDLRVPGISATRETVDVARDGDAPALIVEMSVGEWTLRGTTHLRGGEPVSALIKGMEIVKGLGEGTAAEVHSAPDGSFEIKVVSQAGHKMALWAESDEPHAKGGASADLVATALVVDNLDIAMDATGLEVAVTDDRTGQPLEGCRVKITWMDAETNQTYAGYEKKTDADGLVREFGLGKGYVRSSVDCVRHYPEDLGRVELILDQVKHVDVRLRPSQDLTVAARDESGTAIPGASVLVLESPLSYYTAGGMQGAIATAGVTDAAGEVSVRGDVHGGKPVFVVVSSRVLGMGVLPAPAACERPDDCRLKVVLPRPGAFAGLAVRSESGAPIQPWSLTFYRGGIPIPRRILSAVLSANALPADGATMPLEIRFAAFLPEGRYAVTMGHTRPHPTTGAQAFVESPLGMFVVPSLERVELLDRDGVSTKPANAVAPRVAER